MTSSELIPFNLERALAGDQVVTRDGAKVTELHYFSSAHEEEQKLCCIIEGNAEWFHLDGKYASGDDEYCNDLFMAPKVKKIWVNVYHNKNKIWLANSHDTEEEARKCIGQIRPSDYIKTICITDEPE